jgi:hypothetical protein
MCNFYIPDAAIGAIVGATISGCFLLAVRHQQKKELFETGFFNLLASIRNLVANSSGKLKEYKEDNFASVPQNLPEFKGNEFFQEANKTLHSYLKKYQQKMFNEEHPGGRSPQESSEIIKRYTVNAYNHFFDEHVSELGHYFRYVFNVIKHVHESSKITNEEKSKYINLIQAQMSADELALIFFNGLGKYGEKFHYFIEKYNFLENVDTNVIEDLKFYAWYYPKSKFRFKRGVNEPTNEFINRINI